MPVVALLIAVANLIMLAAYTRARRQFRQAVWMSEPRRLTETTPGPTSVAAIGVAGGVAAFGLFGVEPEHWATPMAAAMSAPAVLGWAHIWQWRGVAVVGLLMTMLVPVAMFVAWGFGWTLGLLPGFVFGAAWMLWLAAFWRQQISPEGAWTTAGGLIPAARWVGVIGVMAAFAAALFVATHDACPSVVWWVWVVLGGLFLARAVVMNVATRAAGSVAGAATR